MIIGAGPVGSALGIWLRRRGASVTLVEAVERPESVVGESMLPCVGPLLDELGLDMSGYLVKHGAVFCRDADAARFDFADADQPRYTYAWQVQRERFDLELRRLAVGAGCALVHATARRAELPGTLHTDAGTLHAGLIVDAAGRGMWLANQMGARVADPTMRNAAIATRVRGYRPQSPEEVGDIVICCIPRGWIWIIPFADGTASVGVVMAPGCPLDGGPEQRLNGALALSAAARSRLDGCTRLLPFRGLSDWTASADRFSGDGWALCGDAAAFLDPVFSSGVLLGLESAKGLVEALDGGDLSAWEANVRLGVGVFRRFVDAWYDGDFMDVALAPVEIQRTWIKVGITTLLAGDVWRGAAARTMGDRIGGLAGSVRQYRAGRA